MNLNKGRRKKLKYDGDKIIRIGAKEVYPFVYQRIWDLTEYDSELLRRYGLEKAKYLYIGSSNKYNLNSRCNNWKYDIEKNRKNVSKEIRCFIFKLKKFYKLETSYRDDEVEYLLYYNAKIIARCDSLKNARKKEKQFTTGYHYLDDLREILDNQYILLSKKDSSVKRINVGGFELLKYK